MREGEAADTSQLLISFLPDLSLHLPERGLDSSKSLASQGPPAFSILWFPGTDPHPADSSSLSTFTHSFLTSFQEVTGTLVRSLPSITAILILMFTCLCILCRGGWGRSLRGCDGGEAGGPGIMAWP